MSNSLRPHGLYLQARVLEWVAYLFSSRSSQPRNQTGVSWIASWFFTYWAIWEQVPNLVISPCYSAAKSLQSCPTLCDPIDGSPPGSPVPGILKARTLEWVAISFSNAWEWKVKVKLLSRVRLLATPWTVAHQAPPSMGFSRQEYWSGVPLHVTLILPNYGVTKSRTRVTDWTELNPIMSAGIFQCLNICSRL